MTKLFFKQVEKENGLIGASQLLQRLQWMLSALEPSISTFNREIEAYNSIMSVVYSSVNFAFPWLDKFLYKFSQGRRKVHSQLDSMNDLFARMIAKKRQDMANTADTAEPSETE
ncbi:hypothetical protein BZG36_05454 [Bifiguratus adelaidae]|uniref:Uncharacterized protein n=1 Tax=Bifiguratus adelaidae TaxID=1938954 RepID=A0A261XTR5_9FUNG|nr:hypothetical protein BZG36_05454 [Bifiguratus adelaidae]